MVPTMFFVHCYIARLSTCLNYYIFTNFLTHFSLLVEFQKIKRLVNFRSSPIIHVDQSIKLTHESYEVRSNLYNVDADKRYETCVRTFGIQSGSE